MTAEEVAKQETTDLKPPLHHPHQNPTETYPEMVDSVLTRRRIRSPLARVTAPAIGANYLNPKRHHYHYQNPSCVISNINIVKQIAYFAPAPAALRFNDFIYVHFPVYGLEAILEQDGLMEGRGVEV